MSFIPCYICKKEACDIPDEKGNPVCWEHNPLYEAYIPPFIRPIKVKRKQLTNFTPPKKKRK